MQCHRIEELLELLQPAWIKEQDLSLVQFVAKLAEEAGFDGPLSALTDDMLIYHLKMRESDKQAMIPGLAKDHVPDFKEALLKATGEGFTQAPEALCWDELDAAMPAIHHAGQHWHALGLALPGSTLAVVMADAQVLRNATLHELQSRTGAQLQGRPRCFPPL